LSAGEFCTIVDGKADKRIWDATAYLGTFDAAGGMDGDLKDTDSCIERFTGQKLFEIEGKDVGLIHHGAECSMSHITNEG